jgi:hypothetical protein
MLSQSYNDIILPVDIAFYNAEPLEPTQRTYRTRSGTRRSIDQPTYCISNIDSATSALLAYIIQFRNTFLRDAISFSNPVTSSVLQQALHYDTANPNSLVSHALDLCAAARIIEHDWHFVSPADKLDALGLPICSSPFISPEDMQTCPWPNQAPVTPMMDTQLDQIVTRTYLTRTRQILLKKLETALTIEYRKERWLELFLTICILMIHEEFLLQHSRRMSLRVGAKNRYVSMARTESYFAGACTILCWWHWATRISGPLQMLVGSTGDYLEQKASVTKILKYADLKVDEANVGFLVGLKDRISSGWDYMSSLRERAHYEQELFWCHQVFDTAWRADGSVKNTEC